MKHIHNRSNGASFEYRHRQNPMLIRFILFSMVSRV